MGLHVGGICTKDFFQAVDGELLGHINVFATTVVAATWVAFCVFVGELCACCLQNGRRGIVFASDQLDMVFLALVFGLDGGPDFGIGIGNGVRITVEPGSWLSEWLTLAQCMRQGCPGERQTHFRCRNAAHFPVVVACGWLSALPVPRRLLLLPNSRATYRQ